VPPFFEKLLFVIPNEFEKSGCEFVFNDREEAETCYNDSPCKIEEKALFCSAREFFVTMATVDLGLKSVAELCRRHRRWLLLCLAAAIVVETFLWVYPPRGLACSDTILLGSVGKIPLVDFPRVWARFFNDDRFMLQTVRDSAVFGDIEESQLLKVVQNSIRPNLFYGIEQDSFAKITFRQPTANRIRGFLTSFTRRLLVQLTLLGEEELSFQQARVLARARQSLRRQALLQNGLGSGFLVGSTRILVEIPSLTDFPPVSGRVSLLLASESVNLSGGWWSFAGTFISNEFEDSLYNTLLEWKTLVATDGSQIGIFPRSPILLSDSGSLPAPMQPFLFLIYVLVPIGFFLVGCSWILILAWLEQTAPPPSAA